MFPMNALLGKCIFIFVILPGFPVKIKIPGFPVFVIISKEYYKQKFFNKLRECITIHLKMPRNIAENGPAKAEPEGYYICADEEFLSYDEAAQVAYVGATAPLVCRSIAILALHQEDVLTQGDLMCLTGGSQAAISRVMTFLYRTRLIEKGAMPIVDTRKPLTAFRPVADFDRRVREVPEWLDAIEERDVVAQVNQVAQELGLSYNGAVLALVAYYRKKGRSPRPTTDS